MPRTSTEARPRTASVAAALSLAVWCGVAALRLAAPLSPPDPSAVAALPVRAILGLGVPERRATLAWWQLGRRWASGAALDPAATAATIQRIGALDPGWRTPWIYGGLMLQAQGDEASLEAARTLLHDGADRWPRDPWFPAALGVQLRDQGQVEAARAWLREARERS